MLAALVVGACGSISTSVGVESEIRIGVPISLTGVNQKLGLQTQQGYQIWADWVDNAHGGLLVGNQRHKVKLIYKDDQSAPPQTTIQTQSLISDDQVQFLLGTYGTTATYAEAVLAEKAGLPLVEANGNSETQIFSKGYTYVFDPAGPAKNYLKSTIDMAVTLDPKPSTVAILYASDAFSVEVADAAKSYAASLGLQVVYYETYPDNGDPSASLPAVQAAAPDVILQAGHDAEAVAMIKGMKSLKIAPRLFASTVGPATPEFVAAVGKDADFVVTPSQWTGAMARRETAEYFLSTDDYLNAYHQKYPDEAPSFEDPAYQVADGTAAAVALGAGIEKANSLDPNKVRDALQTLDIDTFYGKIKFGSNGINEDHPIVVVQIQDGKHVTVFPKDLANASLRYPYRLKAYS